jgi:uncharacterized protein YbjT (DUF2867 family)
VTSSEQRTIVVCGATGRQGGAVARHLLSEGWQVRALTRNARSAKAEALARLGAVVVRGDMDDLDSLRQAFAGAYGLYSVQNPYIDGPEAEIRQGRNVAEVAKEAGVQHLVYGSAGTGRKGTGIPSWESKLQVEGRMRELGLPLTILRPMAFMELMADKGFYPALTTWHVMPTLVGPSRKVPWLCTNDLGAIAARVFQRPEPYIGQDLRLASDEKSISECWIIYRAVIGRNPPRFPVPVSVFSRFGFVGRDLTAMYRWLRMAELDVDTELTRSILPGAVSVDEWLRKQRT